MATKKIEPVKLREWVVAQGLKVCIVFEGRDGAGKGAPSRRSPSASAGTPINPSLREAWL